MSYTDERTNGWTIWKARSDGGLFFLGRIDRSLEWRPTGGGTKRKGWNYKWNEHMHKTRAHSRHHGFRVLAPAFSLFGLSCSCHSVFLPGAYRLAACCFILSSSSAGSVARGLCRSVTYGFLTPFRVGPEGEGRSTVNISGCPET